MSEPHRASPEEQQEQAIQTSAISEPLKKTSVSIAVGTGAQKLDSISLLCFTSFTSLSKSSDQLNLFITLFTQVPVCSGALPNKAPYMKISLSTVILMPTAPCPPDSDQRRRTTAERNRALRRRNTLHHHNTSMRSPAIDTYSNNPFFRLYCMCEYY